MDEHLVEHVVVGQVVAKPAPEGFVHLGGGTAMEAGQSLPDVGNCCIVTFHPVRP